LTELPAGMKVEIVGPQFDAGPGVVSIPLR
jgi:hypothetical protein